MPGLSLQAVLIWFSCPILQLLCVYLLYRRKLLRQFAFFASYLIFLTLLNGVRFFCYRQFGFSSWAYYSVYWIGTAVANMLVIAVLYELFCAAFKPFAGLQDLAKIVFKWAAGAMVFIGLVVFLSRATSAPGAPYRWLASGILDFERIVSVMEIALLILLFVGSQHVGLAMKTRVFGFALGFGFHAICNLLIYLTLITSHVNRIPLWEQLLSEAYYVSLLIWAGYLLKPESSEPVQIPATSPLLRWNEAAQQPEHSGGQIALFSLEPLMPQVERIFERVLKKELAASLSLLLVRQGQPNREFFQQCDHCGACYDCEVSVCPSDGSSTTTIHMPRVLGRRYRLLRRIGQGGMGTVYFATDNELDRHVAAKLIREGLVGNSSAAQRFNREAQIAASFSHPNVVTIHDFGMTSANRAFLIMELLEGRPLREEMKQTGQISCARTLQILRGICAALHAAHQQHLVHRDIKPENIFLATVGDLEVPKLLDFGLAKFMPSPDTLGAETASGELVGTRRYMSPEQRHGLAVDPVWDLWAISVVAYEMLTGKPPFTADTEAGFHAVLAGRFVPVHNHLPSASHGLVTFFESTFSTNPALRPGSAKEWLGIFERALVRNASTRGA